MMIEIINMIYIFLEDDPGRGSKRYRLIKDGEWIIIKFRQTCEGRLCLNNIGPIRLRSGVL